MKKTLSVLCFILFSVACSKTTTYPTQAQLTAKRLTQFFGSASNSLADGRFIYIMNSSGYLIYTATSFKITDDGFILLSGAYQTSTTFNLEYLTKYQEYDVGTNNYELDFTF